jgi:hypothetical protein
LIDSHEDIAAIPWIVERENAEAELNTEPKNTRMIVNHDQDIDCLVGVVEGRLDMPAVQQYVHQVVREARLRECTCIVSDLRGAELDLSTIEIYGLPGLLDRMGFGRPWCGALVVSGDTEDFKFLETVAYNRGFRLRVFNDIGRAMEWVVANR